MTAAHTCRWQLRRAPLRPLGATSCNRSRRADWRFVTRDKRGIPTPVQEVVKSHPKSCGLYAHNAIKPIQELIALARAQRLPVIYTTSETRHEVNPAGVYATKHEFRGEKEAFDIREDFKPEPGDLVVYKQRASAFFGTALITNLTRLGVDSLIVCGESTSGVCAPQRWTPIPTVITWWSWKNAALTEVC